MIRTQKRRPRGLCRDIIDNLSLGVSGEEGYCQNNLFLIKAKTESGWFVLCGYLYDGLAFLFVCLFKV